MYGYGRLWLPAAIVAGIVTCGFVMADTWGKVAFIVAGLVIFGMAG